MVQLEPMRIAGVAAATVITAFAMPDIHLAVPRRDTGLAWLTAGRKDEAGEWFHQAWDYTKRSCRCCWVACSSQASCSVVPVTKG